MGGGEEVLLWFGDYFWTSRRVPVSLITLAVVVVLSPFLFTLLFTLWKARRVIAVAESTPPGLKRPPTLPYAVPYIGHLFRFMLDGHSLMSNAA